MVYEFLFGVSDEIQDITRGSRMVQRIRFIYRKAVFGFRNRFGMFGIVPEGSRSFRSGTNVAPLVGGGVGLKGSILAALG